MGSTLARSLKPRLSMPDFVSQLRRKLAVIQNLEQKTWVQGYLASTYSKLGFVCWVGGGMGDYHVVGCTKLCT